jgi:hypothetical protein
MYYSYKSFGWNEVVNCACDLSFFLFVVSISLGIFFLFVVSISLGIFFNLFKSGYKIASNKGRPV